MGLDQGAELGRGGFSREDTVSREHRVVQENFRRKGQNGESCALKMFVVWFLCVSF